MLKNAMKLHVVGVTFHGTPDSVHLFAASPHLAGNSNLNCEALFRAVKAQYEEHGMLPRMHVQALALAHEWLGHQAGRNAPTQELEHRLITPIPGLSSLAGRWTMQVTTRAGGCWDSSPG